MRSTQHIVDEIKQNAIESIEINNQVICGRYKFPDLGRVSNHLLKAIYVGNNKAIAIACRMVVELYIIDLATKTAISKTLPIDMKFFAPYDYVVLDNADSQYVAISVISFAKSLSKLLILNTQTMQIEKDLPIAEAIYTPIKLFKHNNQLFGLTANTPPVFFSAPATFDSSFAISSKVNMHTDVSSGRNFVIDRRSNMFLPYQKHSTLVFGLKDSVNVKKMAGTNKHEYGENMLMIQQGDEHCYLMYYDTGSEYINIYKGGPGYWGIEPTLLHGICRFLNEQIQSVVVLSEADKLILVSTNDFSYIYNLNTEMRLAKLTHLIPNKDKPVIRPIKDGVIFETVTDRESRKSEMLALTFDQMQNANELIPVFEAILADSSTSVKKIFISDAHLNEATLQRLVKLSQKPGIELILSETIKSLVDGNNNHEAKHVASSARIEVLQDTLQTERVTITQLRGTILDESKRFSNEKQLLEAQLIEQVEQNHSALAALEQKMSDQAAAFMEREQTFLVQEQKLQEQYQNDVVTVQNEMKATAENYERLLRQVSIPQLPAIPLAKKLQQTDEFSPEICMELVDPRHNIKGLSLIQWSNEPDLKNIEEDLKQRGAILHVYDLVDKIEKVAPPHNEKSILKAYTKAIERLMRDYENKKLPEYEMKSLVALILADLQKEIDLLPWLQELYVPEADNIKNEMVDKFFSRDVNELETAAVEKEFKRAVNEILQNTKLKPYHARLQNHNLLDSLRDSGHLLAPLIKLIKAKIDLTNIELSEKQQVFALKAMTDNPTNELKNLIHEKIIHYWQELKAKINPQLLIIQQLGNTVKDLENRISISQVPASLFHPKEEKEFILINGAGLSHLSSSSEEKHTSTYNRQNKRAP